LIDRRAQLRQGEDDRRAIAVEDRLQLRVGDLDRRAAAIVVGRRERELEIIAAVDDPPTQLSLGAIPSLLATMLFSR
jgi:hypothetical protein